MNRKDVPGMLDLDTLRREIGRGEIDTVLTVFPDMYGRLVGKRITGHFFLDHVAEDGMHACNYLLACDMEMDPVPGYKFASWETGYGDFRAKPDWNTLRRAAWLPKTALVMCDLHGESDDEPVEVAPRRILARQIERARAAGYEPMGGSELEFFIFKDGFETAREKRYHDLETFGWYIEDYHILQGTKQEGLIRAIRNLMDASGVPVEFSKGEWGPGQHEINLQYADFMEMADRHAIYKQAAKEIAYEQGLAVTFMAKWDERLAGSSMHLHVSLWDSDSKRSLFPGDRRAGGAGGAGPIDASDIFRWFLGGWVSHARELAVFYAPYVNSYKRYQAGSFAPTATAWSYDNRTAGFRVVGQDDSLRIECRIPGADANCYLAFAATLAAGMNGIENKIEPPETFEGDVYKGGDLPRVPDTLHAAIDCFEASELARDAFGHDVVEHYLHFFRTEQRKFDQAVTCWERTRFFERA